MSSQFNAFEEAIDFFFWWELCEKNDKLRHSRCNEYFACTEEVKNAHKSVQTILSQYIQFVE